MRGTMTLTCPACENGSMYFRVYSEARTQMEPGGDWAEFRSAECACVLDDAQYLALEEEAAAEYEWGGGDED